MLINDKLVAENSVKLASQEIGLGVYFKNDSTGRTQSYCDNFIVTHLPRPENNRNFVVFKDEFNNPDSGWNVSRSGNVTKRYFNGCYEMTALELHPTLFASVNTRNNFYFSNFSLEAQMWLADNSWHSAYGLAVICNADTASEFSLYFLVNPVEKLWGLYQLKDGVTSELAMVTDSALINSDHQPNKVKILHYNGQLLVYINQHLAEKIDFTESFDRFQAGLFIQGFSDPATVLYDNLIVTKINEVPKELLK